MSSDKINVLSYVVILADTCPLDTKLASRLLALEKRIANAFPYHELLLLSHHSTHDAAALNAISQIPNIRLLTVDTASALDILERVSLREAIGDAILISLWPDEEGEAERLLDDFAKNHLQGVDYISVKFVSGNLSQLLEKRFEMLCKTLIGYAPELSMSTSACYSRTLAGRVNASRDYTTPVKLSYEVASSKKRMLEAGRKVRGMKKMVRRAFWALEVFGSASPALLTLASFFCFFSALGSAMYAAYVVLVWFIKNAVAEGWFSSNFVIAVMLTVLFFTLGLFSVVGAHILRRGRYAALPAVTVDISRSDFVKTITSNVETE